MNDHPEGPGNEIPYQTQSRYMLFALIPAVCALVLAWQISAQFDPVAVVFFLIALAATVWAVVNMLSRVRVNEHAVTLRHPLKGVSTVEFRQLISVHTGGRLLPNLVLFYHPRAENDLLDLDEVRSLTLPALEEQETLLDTLQAAVRHYQPT